MPRIKINVTQRLEQLSYRLELEERVENHTVNDQSLLSSLTIPPRQVVSTTRLASSGAAHRSHTSICRKQNDKVLTRTAPRVHVHRKFLQSVITIMKCLWTLFRTLIYLFYAWKYWIIIISGFYVILLLTTSVWNFGIQTVRGRCQTICNFPVLARGIPNSWCEWADSGTIEMDPFPVDDVQDSHTHAIRSVMDGMCGLSQIPHLLHSLESNEFRMLSTRLVIYGAETRDAALMRHHLVNFDTHLSDSHGRIEALLLGQRTQISILTSSLRQTVTVLDTAIERQGRRAGLVRVLLDIIFTAVPWLDKYTPTAAYVAALHMHLTSSGPVIDSLVESAGSAGVSLTSAISALEDLQVLILSSDARLTAECARSPVHEFFFAARKNCVVDFTAVRDMKDAAEGALKTVLSVVGALNRLQAANVELGGGLRKILQMKEEKGGWATERFMPVLRARLGIMEDEFGTESGRCERLRAGM